MFDSGRPVVLVIEDSPADQEIVRRAFLAAEKDCDVRMVLDGEAALSYLLRRDEFSSNSDAPLPHLILLDLNLPNLTGREVLERIRQQPALRHIAVIILTTTQAPHEVLECYRVGANCFLTKPSSFLEFVDLINITCHYWFHLAKLPTDIDPPSPPGPAS